MKKGEAPVLNRAAELLARRPSGTEDPAEQILDYFVNGLGISRGTLMKAKEMLGIESVQRGHKWYWRWPE